MPTDLELAALAAANLAVRRDPAAADAVETCRTALADQVPDGQRIALLVGWGYLALDEPTEAWECFRAAVSYETEPHLTDRAALLAGLLAARELEAPALAGAWYRASTELITVLDQINFTDDLTTRLTDDLIWPDHPELRADVLPHLVESLDARSRSLAALTLYAVHHANGDSDAAVRAAWQVVRLGHPTYLAAAWLGIAETLIKQGDTATAAKACQEARTAEGRFSARLLLGLAEGSEPDVQTQAEMLLGTLQGDYSKLAEYKLSEQHQDAIFELGLRAKDRRDLPEATRWFRQYIEAGYAAHPLAAAHLGELAYWVGDKQTALHWYQYTLDHTDLPVLVEEAEQRMAELRAS
ncbi:hypothetical protein [Kribbella sindirgiensis]|uniref:Tetratricopeptide repeat protein n=1 Tax=Kribbella sindirgiensis TaxID=1124744 RepID=A0A4R0I8I3_9ACTN|nr:hypothetical protein [Kribbella sindirgiensis]TCC26103.1 hypothetical protein E0H50_31745 [Kribbella sindirgiensis]